MGLLSKIKDLGDEKIKEWTEEAQRDAEIRKEFGEYELIRREKRKRIEKYIRKDPPLGMSGNNLLKLYGTSDMDGFFKEFAPNLTAMLSEIYLWQEENANWKSRYDELSQRYTELMQAYEKQTELLAAIAQNK